ncbi:MAG: hypothetical protein ACM3S4_13260 [Burkholderiales bacterium]
MNRKLGLYSSIVTLAAVLAFAVSMLASTSYGAYLSSLFIAWGFVPLICAFAAAGGNESKAAGYTAAAFASVYAALNTAVYFTQLTTVALTRLDEQASVLLDYSKFGLMFNLDLLGYAFMALATFFAGLTIKPEDSADKLLKKLLLVHGVFAVSCTVMPMLGVFRPGMAGGDLIGTLVLEYWCAYFTSVCILAFRYFRKQKI